MHKSIACLLLVALLGMISPPLPAQQNQNPQKFDTEIEALKKRVSELEKQLQTVENAEKLDLQAQLAEANAKLANAEFGKFERELRDSNNEWLKNWVLILLAILSAVGVGIWRGLKNRTNELIADTVEKNLNGFKKSVEGQELIKDQLRELRKDRVVSVLTGFNYVSNEEQDHPEEIKVLPEEDLLQVLDDGKFDPPLRSKAAAVLTARNSSRSVPPMLTLLNSVIGSDSDINFPSRSALQDLVKLLGKIHTRDAYQGLKEFLNRLVTENPKHRDLFLTETVYSLAWLSIKLNLPDSVPILRMATPHLQVAQEEHQAMKNLARHFDIFDEPAGIKEILINHVTSESSDMEDIEDWCLELLQKHDPKYVADWRASRAADNNEA